MKNNINAERKIAAEKYIANNCKLYRKFFYNRNMNVVIKNAIKILKAKLLSLNSFCYYINDSLIDMLRGSLFYIELPKHKRKQLEYYQRTVIKIYMHINDIFILIDEIENYNNKHQ